MENGGNDNQIVIYLTDNEKLNKNEIDIKGKNKENILNSKNEVQISKVEKEDNTKDIKNEEESDNKGLTSLNQNKNILKNLNKKVKYPVIPYKISSSYQAKLLAALKKDNNLRPKTLFAPEKDDITRNIDILDEEEEEDYKKEETEDKNFEEKEKEDKIYLNKYKEQTILGNTSIEDPMALFSEAEKVYIDQFYKFSDLFVICPLYFNYRISLEYVTSDKNDKKKEYTAYHLFNTKEISPLFSHNFCANQSREININIFNYIVDSKDKQRNIQKFISLKKNCRCAVSCLCSCCSRPTFIVETPIEEIGTIVEIRTICDPILKVLDINKDTIYTISTKCSDCGYCLRDQCYDSRKCSECNFIIYDAEKKNGLGTIFKTHRSGKKVKPDYDQLIVTYPPISSCQQKVLLMCTAIVLEYLYFQNMTNTKRCFGNPRFLNSFSN